MTCRATCCVQGCRNTKRDKKYSFFKLPTNKERCKRWLTAVGRPDMLQRHELKPECHFVCSAHFEKSMILYKPLLKPDAVPTRLIPKSPEYYKKNPITCIRKSRSTQTDDTGSSKEDDITVESENNAQVDITLEPMSVKTEPGDGEDTDDRDVPSLVLTSQE